MVEGNQDDDEDEEQTKPPPPAKKEASASESTRLDDGDDKGDARCSQTVGFESRAEESVAAWWSVGLLAGAGRSVGQMVVN